MWMMIADASPKARPQGRPPTGHVRLVVHVKPTTNATIRAKAAADKSTISAAIEALLVDRRQRKA